MSQVNAPFGFRPVYHPSGAARASAYQLAPGAASILKNQPVSLATTGTVQAAAAASDLLGTLAGVLFTDPLGKPNLQPNWIAGTPVMAGTPITAYVFDDPDTVFEVQSDGTLALTAVGDQADLTNAGAGSTMTGLSASTLSATLAGAGVQGQFRIIEAAPYTDNAFGDPFVVVNVTIARHQYRANKVAI